MINDYDTPWKEVIEQYFTEFIAFFFPQAYKDIDWHKGYELSFAVLGDSSRTWRPDKFERQLWGCEIRFRFPIVKLSDYEKEIESLKADDNPFAVVVIAHLLTQATAKDYGKRRNEKLELIKQLYRKGFSKQNIINLFRFIDWIMALPETEEMLFSQELAAIEQEGKMPYVTSIERIGFKRGQFTMIANQIAKKFGSQAEKELSDLKDLDSDTLLDLGVQLFDFHSFDEVRQWISKKINIKKIKEREIEVT